ncbi:hypothetical protein J5N97_018129 [Dioscorea zingiberensis]|uniref:Uncharacterized protein n=1 Tax=Dioscorea zingiberensis TaxID=325984 RepID=A0A9D5CNR2_9LILI|nr:hypothetical protein J5N97_018129 [Dioscorea zingiberensis]
MESISSGASPRHHRSLPYHPPSSASPNSFRASLRLPAHSRAAPSRAFHRDLISLRIEKRSDDRPSTGNLYRGRGKCFKISDFAPTDFIEMDNNEVIRWWTTVQNMVAYVVCLVAQWHFIQKHSRKRKITYSISSGREQNRDEMMNTIMDSEHADDDMDIISPSPGEHMSPSPHGASGGNKKSRKTIDKEKDVAEGMEDAIEKMADAIRSSVKLITENIKTSREVIARKAPISPTETYQMLLDLDFQPPLLHNIYSKLVMNVDVLNAVLGCPMEHRREFILSGILGDLRNLNM